MIRLEDIESFLIAEQIEFKKQGSVRQASKFCSLKRIEPNGLYYVVGDLTRDFVNSLR